jgi:hypothetical protein
MATVIWTIRWLVGCWIVSTLSWSLPMPLDSSQSGGLSSPQGNIRTTQATTTSSSIKATTAATLRSSCICGSISLQISNVHMDTLASDCQCSSCRRYHTSAFASYLQVSSDSVQWKFATEEPTLRSYMDKCQELGSVERFFCHECGTKLATRQFSTQEDRLTSTATTAAQKLDKSKELSSNDFLFLNMGPLEEETIPESLALNWQFHRQSWPKSIQQQPTITTTTMNPTSNKKFVGAIWSSALPEWDDLDYNNRPGLRTIHGGCACGMSQYTIRYYTPPSELQHCYCRLCRQCSGSAFQTWVPIPTHFFSWNMVHSEAEQQQQQSQTALDDDNHLEPEFIRTTSHGGRHMCRNCRGVLTIEYDEDEGETIWPAAGGFHDESLPFTQEGMNAYLDRVVHIGCSWKQSWYSIPHDGLDRIDMAS